jgi:TRAP-type C4-dicarboxylate transport system permease small subunit
VVALNRWSMIGALAVMSGVVFASVVVRYLVDYSVPWSEEVARYLMVWLTFLGIGPVLRIGGHVAIDTLQDALPAPVARLLRVLIFGSVAVFLVLLAWYGRALVGRTLDQTTAVTELSFAWVTSAVPTGAVLALWHLCAMAHDYLVERRFQPSTDVDPSQIAAA